MTSRLKLAFVSPARASPPRVSNGRGRVARSETWLPMRPLRPLAISLRVTSDQPAAGGRRTVQRHAARARSWSTHRRNHLLAPTAARRRLVPRPFRYGSSCGSSDLNATNTHWSDDISVRVRPTRRGNRQLNAALHRIAVTQIRLENCPGRIYHRRRLDDGDTRGQALRALKRRLCRAVFQALKADRTAERRGVNN